MISRSAWLKLKRGDLLKCGRNVRKIHSVHLIPKKCNSQFECLFVTLRKIRPSWTDPHNPWTVYLFTDLRWSHRIVRH